MQAVHTRARGFTLIEMVVTLAVIAVAVGLAGPNLLGWRTQVRLKGASRELSYLSKMARARALESSTRHVLVIYRGVATESKDDLVAIFGNVPTTEYDVTAFSTDQLKGIAAPPAPLTYVIGSTMASEIGFGPGVTRTFPYPYSNVTLADSCSFCSGEWGALFFEDDGKIGVSNGTTRLAPDAAPAYVALTLSAKGDWVSTPTNYYAVIISTKTGASSVWNATTAP